MRRLNNFPTSQIITVAFPSTFFDGGLGLLHQHFYDKTVFLVFRKLASQDQG